MPQLERQFQKAVLKEIRALHRDFHFLIYNSKGSVSSSGAYYKDRSLELGVPDLVGYYIPTGRIVFIELKVGKGVLNDNQKAFHNRIKATGQYIKTCWSNKEVIDFLDEIRVSEQKKSFNKQGEKNEGN